jgi:hypothetical protein
MLVLRAAAAVRLAEAGLELPYRALEAVGLAFLCAVPAFFTKLALRC